MKKNTGALLALGFACILCLFSLTAAGEEKTVFFQDTGEILMNKEMGWVLLEEPLYAGRASLGWEGDFPEVSSVSMSMNWANIEIADGVYEWKYLDEAIEYWTAFGKRINFRIAGDQNGIGYPTASAPDWLGDQCGVPYTKGDTGNRSYYLEHPTFLEKHDRFVWALADRYRDHPMIDVIEIRAYGSAGGEWHTSGNFSSVEKRVEVLRHIIDVWCEAWGEEKLMVVSGSHEFNQTYVPYTVMHESMQRMSDFAYVSAFDHAVQKGVAFRRDGIGAALVKWDEKMISDTFTANNRLPSLGEHFGGYAVFLNKENGYDLWEMMYEAMYHLRVSYMTAIGWVAEPFNEVTVPKEQGGSPEIIDFGNRYMGYRLMPHMIRFEDSLTPGDNIRIQSLWANLGSGRAWNSSHLTWYLMNDQGEIVWQFTDTAFDPVIMNAGDIHLLESKNVLPGDLPTGEYALLLGITNPETNEIELKLPIAGRDEMGRYFVGKITLGESKLQNNEIIDLLAGAEITAYPEDEKSSGVVLDVALPAGDYLITLDYCSSHKPENIEITSTERYILALMKDGKVVQQYLWRDVSALPASRTLLVSAAEEGEYTIQLKMKKNYPLTVESLTALPVSGAVTEDFEGSAPHLITATQDTKYALDKQYAITGKQGLRIRNLNAGQRAEGAYSQPLRPNTAYLISFGTQGYGGDYPGAHYYMDLVYPDDPEKTCQIAAWYDRNDFGPVHHTWFFITPDATDCYLSFGTYQKASFTMDNVVLLPLGEADNIITGEMPEIPRNESRVPLFTGYPIQIDFEGGSVHSVPLTPGPGHQGRLTDKENEVIDGNYSGYGFVQEGTRSNICFLQSTTHEIPLPQGYTYQISFDYRICRAPDEGDRVVFNIHPTNGSPVLSYPLKGEEGEIISFSCEYPAQAPNAILTWTVEGSGAVAVDNMCIRQGEN